MVPPLFQFRPSAAVGAFISPYSSMMFSSRPVRVRGSFPDIRLKPTFLLRVPKPAPSFTAEYKSPSCDQVGSHESPPASKNVGVPTCTSTMGTEAFGSATADREKRPAATVMKYFGRLLKNMRLGAMRWMRPSRRHPGVAETRLIALPFKPAIFLSPFAVQLRRQTCPFPTLPALQVPMSD